MNGPFIISKKEIHDTGVQYKECNCKQCINKFDTGYSLLIFVALLTTCNKYVQPCDNVVTKLSNLTLIDPMINNYNHMSG